MLPGSLPGAGGWPGLARVFYPPHEMPTDRRAGILPALVVRTLQADRMPARRLCRCEMFGLGSRLRWRRFGMQAQHGGGIAAAKLAL